MVRFGWGLTWVEATLPRGASCSTASFGSDPAPEIRKVCECAPAEEGADEGEQRRDELGVSWARCAAEGSDCECPSGAVRFGAGVRWVVSEPGEDTVRCSASSFQGTDPVVGTGKECWCEQRHAPAMQARAAIVMLSRRPPDLLTWLRYHLDYMGVERIFVQVEDTPEFNGTWSALTPSHQQRVTVWRSAAVGAGPDRRPADDYESLQARQIRAMHRARTEALSLGIQWLVHIDDDELLYTPLHRSLGDLLASMPEGFDQAYIPNVEAVYPSADVRSCFTETTEINMNRFTFNSYANGKAAVRVADDDVQPAGPHQWRTRWGEELSSISLDKEPFGSPLVVVHFESCPFERWEDKFWELGNTSPQKVSAIPFKFYKESILQMQRCRGSAQDVNAPPSASCSEAALRSLWARWKTEANPSLRRQDLMPLRIPWSAVSAAAAAARL